MSPMATKDVTAPGVSEDVHGELQWHQQEMHCKRQLDEQVQVKLKQPHIASVLLGRDNLFHE